MGWPSSRPRWTASPWSAGKAAGQFEVKRDDNRRRIVWHFPATSNAARTFTVTYRAAGVVWQDTDSDVLAWTLLPTRHEYAIECASGEVDYPAARRLVADAVLDPSAIRGPARRPTRSVSSVARSSANASWVVTMRFAPRSVAPIAPGWQQRSIRNRENTPLFLGLGGLVLLAGIGGFVTVRAEPSPPPHRRLGHRLLPSGRSASGAGGQLISTGASAGWGPVLGSP